MSDTVYDESLPCFIFDIPVMHFNNIGASKLDIYMSVLKIS